MKKAIVRAFVALTVLTMAASFSSCGNNEEPAVSETQPVVSEPVVADVNPLTNAGDFNKAAIGNRPLAVVINNQPQARPQWGLNSADAYFEFPVEGMITRMLWLFEDYDALPAKIGPIRSARHHFVYTASSLDAIYIHWGGSTMGYAAIKDTEIDEIDALNGEEEKYFYRDKTRNTAIEHRGITDGVKLKEAVTTKYDRLKTKNNKIASPFVFSDSAVKLSNPCTSVKYSFSDGFVRSFAYDAEKNLYFNSMNNKPFNDGNDDSQNAVTNVVIMYAPTTTLKNELVNVDLTGGKGTYITNGTYQEINWEKGNNGTDPIKLTYADGSQVLLNTGKTWFNFVPTGRESKTVIA